MTYPQLITDLKEAYRHLGLNNINALESIYSEDVTFIDPVNTIIGRDAMLKHFQNSYQDVLACRFEFDANVEIITQGQAFLSWKMTYQHRKLKSKKPIEVNGASYIQFEQRVIWHRDWFDLGQMVYENIPVVSTITGLIKSRLAVGHN
jgi:hypothetical protein